MKSNNALVPIITSGAARSPDFPDTPTISEVTGDRTLNFTTSVSAYAPSAIDAAFTRRLTRAFLRSRAGVRSRHGSNPEEFSSAGRRPEVDKETLARDRRVAMRYRETPGPINSRRRLSGAVEWWFCHRDITGWRGLPFRRQFATAGWIVDARRQTLGDAQPPIHLRQRDHAAVRRQQAAVETGDTALPRTGDKPSNGSVGLVHDGCGLPEMTRIGFDNQILRQLNGLCYIRQPTNRVEDGRGGLGHVGIAPFPVPVEEVLEAPDLGRPYRRLEPRRRADLQGLHMLAQGGEIAPTRAHRAWTGSPSR